MLNIWDQGQSPITEFRPATISEFFGLQLARALNDVGHLRQYLAAVEEHDEDSLLQAYRIAAAQNPIGSDVASRFWCELRRIISNKPHHD